jgi:TPP-dependent 2-oxoacid decarboxylase
MKITIGDYLLSRLQELGINNIFGVPGDYNLTFLDQIIENNNMNWVGCCNELNAAYAADGYSRIKGFGALVTTFGVGELSAINGIAGAYAERVPVVKIVGTPSQLVQQNKLIVHHTLGNKRFDEFAQMYTHVTVAQAYINEENAAAEIDRVLLECWKHQRPVYIALPCNLSHNIININKKPLKFVVPPSNTAAIDEVITRICSKLKKSKQPVILIDLLVTKFPKLKKQLLKLIEATKLPFATMNMAKGIFDESHPQFIGSYAGALSSVGVQEKVENSDCVISFDSVMSDLNTGGFTVKINTTAFIEIRAFYVKIGQALYKEVYYNELLPELIKKLQDYQYLELHTHKSVKQIQKVTEEYAETKVITQAYFWEQISVFLRADDIVIAEAGTSLFATLQMTLPNECTYISQTLWGSIGYTLGALLGTCMAAPAKRNILFIGDGSLQLTVQTISTIMKHGLNPIIFVINNAGYTIERVIHGATMPYNDIQPWSYAELPKIFGKNYWTTKVKNKKQLEQALAEVNKHADKLKLIELIMDKNDVPPLLEKMFKHDV